MHFPKIKWQKKGLIITPTKCHDWIQTHAMLPTPLQVDGSIYRIYFGSRNNLNQSSIGYVLIDLNEPDKIIGYSENPVLSPGRLGTFDDNGVLPSCLLAQGSDITMYTIGFKPGGTTRMDLFGGAAKSTDNGKVFTRLSEAPILERNSVNPFINTAPWVIKLPQYFRMYYVAGIEWVTPDLPRYNIQTAISQDGIAGLEMERL